MQAPINNEVLQEKWAPLLDHEGAEKITDPHKRMVTAVLLENQENAIREEREFLSEAAPANSTGSSGANAGFSNAGILDIAHVTSYYAYVNRLADGLGVDLESFWEENLSNNTN